MGHLVYKKFAKNTYLLDITMLITGIMNCYTPQLHMSDYFRTLFDITFND